MLFSLKQVKHCLDVILSYLEINNGAAQECQIRCELGNQSCGEQVNKIKIQMHETLNEIGTYHCIHSQ